MCHRRRVALAMAVLMLSVTVQAEEPTLPKAAPPGGDALSLDQYYGDSVSRIGSFPGRLVCVAHDVPGIHENAAPCGSDKVYALAIDNPEEVVPLVASSRAASDQFTTLLDQRVVVRGKHYPDRKMIAVASVESAATAADAPHPRSAPPVPKE
jgi:hypothetical protein